MRSIFARIRSNIRRKRTKKTSKKISRHEALLDVRVSEEFVDCDRYQRRGVVISNCVDQMVSVVIQPNTGTQIVFRMSIFAIMKASMLTNMKENIRGLNTFRDINEVVQFLGPFGRFQRILTGIFCIMILPATFQILILYFGALTSPWRCAANSTVCQRNGTFSNNDRTRCSMERSDWEFTEARYYSIRTQFDIYCDKEWVIHLTTSIFFAAWAVGAVILGWVADNYGRKIVLFPSILIVMLVGFISAFSPNMTFFIICRFIIGFFTPGTGVQMVVLMSEFVSTKYRPAAVTLIWFFFSVALCLLGVKAYFIREWKLLFIINSIPYFFVVFFYKIVPESIRWLHLHAKNAELMHVFHQIAYHNKHPIPEDFTILPFENLRTTKASPLDLFATRRMAFESFVQGYGWLVNGMVYFGLSIAADDLGGSLYRNYVLLSAVEFPANLLTIYLCERIGRKKTTSGTMLLGGIACICCAFIPNTGSIKIVRVCLGIIGKCCITISFSAIYTWSLEIYPTDIRAQGIGFLQIASRIGAASSPWIAKALKVLHRVAPFVLMGILTLIASVLLLFLPETKGKPTRDSNVGLDSDVLQTLAEERQLMDDEKDV